MANFARAALGVPFERIECGMCRAFLDQDAKRYDGQSLCCGRPVMGESVYLGSSYCAAHRSRFVAAVVTTRSELERLERLAATRSAA